ncbi:MAG: hypothetical protein HOL58_00490 [Francisellaceae bacterium]|nr:hypothetical protein [Francisellaceae bacterium]
MVNNKLGAQQESLQKEFDGNVYGYVEKADSKDLRDQKKVALSAIRQMYDYTGSKDKKNSHKALISKILADTNVSRTIAIPSEISGLVHIYTTDFKLGKSTEKQFDSMTRAQVFDDMEGPIGYLKKLSSAYEKEGVLLQRVVQKSKSSETGLMSELDSSFDVKNQQSVSITDEVGSKSYVATALSAIQKGIVAISGDPSANILPGPDNQINEIFDSLNERFAEQTMVVSKSINQFLDMLSKTVDLTSDKWFIENKDSIDEIKIGHEKFMKMDIKKEMLLVEYNDGATTEERKSILAKELKGVQISKCELAAEMSNRITGLCENVPDTDNLEVIESMLLVKLSNDSVMHYQGIIIDKVKQHAEQLIVSEKVGSLDGTCLEAAMNKISGTVSEMLVSKLPEMLNGAPLLQLEGYINRFNLRHELQQDSGYDIEETRTFRSQGHSHKRTPLETSPSLDSVLEEFPTSTSPSAPASNKNKGSGGMGQG